jgi:hypothetical protein
MEGIDWLRVMFIGGLIAFFGSLVWLVVMAYRSRKRRILPILAAFLLLLGALTVLVIYEVDHTFGFQDDDEYYIESERKN